MFLIYEGMFFGYINLKKITKMTSSMVEHLAYNEGVSGSNPLLFILKWMNGWAV